MEKLIESVVEAVAIAIVFLYFLSKFIEFLQIISCY